VNGVTLPYEILGGGKALVMIHGWAVHMGFWDTDVHRFAREYTVIRYDRRGFGEASGKPDLTADASDLAALLDTLELSRVHLMGHSQGAVVALTFALRYPERVDGLILFGASAPPGFDLPPGGDAPPIPEWVAAGKAHGVDSLRAAIGRWAGEHFGDTSAEVTRRALALLESYNGADLLDPAPPSNLALPASMEELSGIAAPTLIINGEREMPSLTVAAAVLAYTIPGARRVLVPGGGHIVNWVEPERFAAEVSRFLRKVDVPAR
jgi:pimeloyl-ACP methyl ester carboxylesterase